MAAMTDYLEGKLVDHILRNVAFTSPTTVYVALFTDATTDASGGTEVTGGSYVRQSVAFDACGTDGITDNTSDVTFPTATADWGTVTNFAVYDADTSGNMMIHGELTSSKAVGDGDTFKFAAGDLDITFA